MVIKILFFLLLLGVGGVDADNVHLGNEENHAEDSRFSAGSSSGAFTTSQGSFTSSQGVFTTGKRGHVKHDQRMPGDHHGLELSPLVIPPDFLPLLNQGERFYYYEGIFYQLIDGALVPVPAPVGILVPQIPSGYEMVEDEGTHQSWYLYKKIYYRKTLDGFEVVKDPKQF